MERLYVSVQKVARVEIQAFSPYVFCMVSSSVHIHGICVSLRLYYRVATFEPELREYVSFATAPEPALQRQGTPNNKKCFADRDGFLIRGGRGGARFIIRGKGLPGLAVSVKKKSSSGQRSGVSKL